MLLPENRVNNSISNTGSPRVAMYTWHFLPSVGGAEQQCSILSAELVKNGAGVFIVTEHIPHTKAYEVINGIRIYRIAGLYRLRKLPDFIRDLFHLRQEEDINKISPAGNKNKFRIIKTISQKLTYGLPNLWFFLSSLWFFYKKRKEFDIIHIHEAHWIASFGITIARLLKKKVIIKEVITGELMTFKTNSRKLQRQLMRADLFIAVSNKISADLISFGVPSSKIRKVPNGVEVNNGAWQFNNSAERSAISIAKLDQLSSRYKGLDILLEAWGTLIQKHKKRARIKIFGRGDSYRINQLAIRLGIGDYIEFPGFTADVKQHLLNSCLFVLPSREEGLSNALLEAMSLGLPCVATDISGNQDLIQNGVNGLLVPGENPDALATAVAFMLDNPDKASTMGKNARRTIEERYAISIICDRYIELYNELIHDGNLTNKCAA